MVLSLEPFLVGDRNGLFLAEGLFADEEGSFGVDGGVLEVVVEVDEAAAVDFEVGVGGLKLVVD